jgi:hypothetical protein
MIPAILACLIVFLVQVSAFGQQQEQDARPLQTVIEEAASKYTLVADEKLIRLPRPVLRFDDSVTLSQHGLVYLWTNSQGLPLAIASFYFQADGARVDEFQSLARSEPLTASFESQQVWKPNSIGLEFKALPREEEVPESREQRTVIMRNAARRFAASVMDRRAGRLELRLLAQPLYRYRDPDRGVLDGAIFAFAKGTNPEVVLLLEAATHDRAKTWHYGLARMTARACRATLDEQEVWTLSAVGYKQASDQPYFNRYTR